MPIPAPHTDEFRAFAVEASKAPESLGRAMSDAMLAAGQLHSLRVVQEHLVESTPLHRALSVVWPDFPDLPLMLAEAEREADMTAAVVEYERRAHEAGVRNRACPCVCGHSGSVGHASALADGDRLPCMASDCRCDDAEYRVEAGE